MGSTPIFFSSLMRRKWERWGDNIAQLPLYPPNSFQPFRTSFPETHSRPHFPLLSFHPAVGTHPWCDLQAAAGAVSPVIHSCDAGQIVHHRPRLSSPAASWILRHLCSDPTAELRSRPSAQTSRARVRQPLIFTFCLGASH